MIAGPGGAVRGRGQFNLAACLKRTLRSFVAKGAPQDDTLL